MTRRSNSGVLSSVPLRALTVFVVLGYAVASCDGCRERPVASTRDAGVAVRDAAALMDAAPADASGPASRVLFQRLGDDLLPFGCWDAARLVLANGAACLALIGRDARVELPERDGPPIVARVSRKLVHLDASEQDLPGLALDLPCRAADGGVRSEPCDRTQEGLSTHAVWPPGGLSVERIEAPDGERDAGTDVPLPPRLESAVAKTLSARWKRVPPHRLRRTVTTDLDGDRQPDLVFVVEVDPPEGAGEDEQGGGLPARVWYLFLEQRDGRFARMSLAEELENNAAGADADVVGIVDLDGDGASELWLHSNSFEGYEDLLARWRPGPRRARWHVVARLSDGS